MSYKKLTTTPPGEIKEINTNAEMTAVLTAENVGKCYKYVGSTSIYINGEIYIVNSNLKFDRYSTKHINSYHIYESDGTTEILPQNWNVAGLANAYYYTKNGGALQRVGGRIFHIDTTKVEGTYDKFYVYDTTNGLQSSLKWSDNISKAMGCTTNTISSGKTNSAIMNTAMGDTSGTIWYFIKNTMNSGAVGGCNDWYIGSTLENDQLRNSGLVNWFSSNNIWSSVEVLNDPINCALVWRYGYGYWNNYTKGNLCCCFAVRSF